jgi:TonB family protein
MHQEYKSKESEPEELSTTGLLWIFSIMVVVIILMFASIYGKGYLYYGGGAFGVMTAIIVHLTIWFISNTSRTRTVMIVHGIIWLIAVTIAVFWRNNREDQELAEFGIVYHAPVIDLYTVSTKRRNPDARFRARIRYEVRGKVYVKSVINRDRILQISDTVRIVYSSKDPVLFGVAAFIKRKAPDKLDTAAFEEVGSDKVPILDPIAKKGDKFPQFRGGSAAFYKYIATHLQHPAMKMEDQVAGEVRLSFIIDKDGSVTDVQVTKGMNPLYDEACVKMLKESPKWFPGSRDGKAIKVKYNVPIKFSL